MNPNQTTSIKTLTAIVLTVTVFVASSVIIVMTQPAEAKFCNPSGCKGTFHYYTEKGHHHCFAHTKGCIHFDYSGKNNHKEHY